ncbi:hypothetical protein ACWDSL_24555 [Streptomyces sp. NPDC000941]
MAINPVEADSMRKHSAWIFEMLLRLLFPGHGRHRAADSAEYGPAVRHRAKPMAPTGAASAEYANGSPGQSRPVSGLPDGHGADMVRPYLVAYEQQREQRQRQLRAEGRLRRRRRRTLWLAVHGIDIGPRVIHGMRVVA